MLDQGVWEDTNFFTMKFIDGMTLNEYRATFPNGIIETQNLLNITIQICNALSYIHSQGIIHRDLKPGNVMIDNTGKAILMDFGLVKSDDFSITLTMEEEIVGTIAYMSPEQGQGLKINYNTDLYSLGIILYQAVTGKLPFTGSSPISIIYKHINESPKAPSAFNSQVSPQLEKIILRLLEKNQIDRYQYAEEIIRDLQKLFYIEDICADTIDLQFPKDFLLVSPTVGRHNELKEIKHHIDNISSGNSKFFFIRGEVGIGKTRLVEDSTAHAKFKDIPVLRAFCYEYENEPYSPFIAIIEAIIQKKKTYIIENLPIQQLQALTYLLPNLANLEIVKTKLADISKIQIKKELLFETIFNTFLQFTKNKPFVLVIENLQWIDQVSLEVIKYLYEKATEYPFVFMTTYRIDEFLHKKEIWEIVKRLEESPLTTKFELTPLSKSDVRKIIKYILGRGDISSGVVNLLVEKSGGNPLFIEEILKDYVEEKIIYSREGNWEKILEIPV